MVDFAVDPRKTALLVIDMQNCFVEGSPVSPPEGPALLKRLNRLADVCRASGVQVIHTAHVLRPDGSNIGVLGEIVPAVRNGMINEGVELAALHKDLSVEKGDIILNKPRFGAFHGTDLELILRSKGIDTVIIGGISTSVCCETTAREATTRDFRVLFLEDGTATSAKGGLSPEEIQKAVCATLGDVFGQVLTVDEMKAKVSSAVSA